MMRFGTLYFCAMTVIAALVSVAKAEDKFPILLFVHAPDFPHGSSIIEATYNQRFAWNQRYEPLTGIGTRKFAKPVHNCAQLLKAVGGEITSSALYESAATLSVYLNCAGLSALGWAAPASHSHFLKEANPLHFYPLEPGVVHEGYFDSGSPNREHSLEREIVEHLDFSTLPLRPYWNVANRGPVFLRDLHADQVQRDSQFHSITITSGEHTIEISLEMAADFEASGRGNQQILIFCCAPDDGSDPDVPSGVMLLDRERDDGPIVAKAMRIRTPLHFDMIKRYEMDVN